MIDAETYLLNTLISFPEEIADASLILKSSDFSQGRQAVIFEELLAMTSRGVRIDVATLAESLQTSGNLGPAGGIDFLRDVTEHISAGAALVPEHARIIREASLRKQMRRALLAALEAVEDRTCSLVEVAGLAESAALAGVQGGENTEKMVWEYIPEVFDVMERQAKGEITGLPTGLFDVDKHLSGFQKGDLIILGGRPRMGKTSLATDIAGSVAIDQKKSVAFFSLEMAGRQIVERHLFTRAKVNGQLLRKGRLPKDQFPKLQQATPQFGKQTKWMVDGGTSLSPLQVLSKCRRQRMKYGLDLIVIDNIQKMKSDSRQKDRRLEIAEITNALKNIAKDLDVPILAISHLNRGPDMRADPEPVLSDLQESGNIEQDADIVLFVYRESEYKKVEPDRINETKLVIAKYRNGQAGHLLLRFNHELCSFENWAGNRVEDHDYKRKQAGDDFYG